MTYLVAADLTDIPAGERFRTLLARPSILQIPGAHNGMAALQAKAAGFEAAYLSGAAMTASMGLPDLGIITVDEVSFFIRQAVRASGLPMLVDGDTGYGEALNVMHMVRCFEDAGAAAVHIEDQILPKKCGHLNDKKLAGIDDMAAKVGAAAKARRHLVIIARTDAAASEGMDGAVARARRYVDAGADAIFPEALHNAEMFREFARRLPGVKLLANMTEFGRTPFFTAAEFEAMGYRMVIWPVSSLRCANRAQEELYAAIRRDGGAHRMIERMQTRPSSTPPSATRNTRRSTARSSPPRCRTACPSVNERRANELGVRGGIRTRGPRIHATSAFAAVPLRERSWSGLSLRPRPKPLGATHPVSTPSRPFRGGLGSGSARCERTGAFPDFERFRRAVSNRDAQFHRTRNPVLYPLSYADAHDPYSGKGGRGERGAVAEPSGPR